MASKRYTTFVILLLLVAGFTLSISAQDEEMSRTGNRPDAPTYGVRGPHPVGTMEMILDNEDRPLPLTIWYPALNPDGLEEARTYPVVYPQVFPPLEAYGQALFEAEPNTTDGPYPLVVFSHGFLSFRTINLYFTEHLASWGFVVIAPDHLGMTANEMLDEPDTFYPMYYNTPTDVSLVIDFAEEANMSGVLEGMIDTERIAASGHSSGGFTALQAVGAQVDVNAVAMACADGTAFGEECEALAPFASEIAALYGLDEVPIDGLLPSIGDDRIDAVIPLAPDNLEFGETGLSAVTVPTLYMVGTHDMFIPYEETTSGFEALSSDTAYMVAFEYANHGLFQNTCPQFPAMAEFGFYELCAEKVWDKERAHDLINHYATAFLLWQLKGDEMAAEIFMGDTDNPLAVEVIHKQS